MRRTVPLSAEIQAEIDSCLQYWFFYAMNDWRSTFSGVNDHEADWELVTVYLAEQEGALPRPAWVAFSSHDHRGDDLRRRWDDPELRRHGDHPVVFPGAGSHSGAVVPGDYVISVDPPQRRKVIAIARRAQRVLAPWRDDTRPASGFGIPFVDYARGDGKAIGPGQPSGGAGRPGSAPQLDTRRPSVADEELPSPPADSSLTMSGEIAARRPIRASPHEPLRCSRS